MNSRKEFLKRILQNDNWARSDEDMLRDYLDKGDISELEELAQEEFNNGDGKNLLNSQSSNAILQRIHTQIGVAKPAKTKLFNIYKLTAAAAVIIVVGSIGFIKREALLNMLYPVNMIQVVTAANEEKTVTFADGTVAKMEENSMLTYPEKFTLDTRDVSLKGEAFFKVAKDKKHPFTVHSPLVNTTVVGTEFNVDDKDSVHAKVVVVSGIVKVQAAIIKQEVRLTPEQGAVFGTDDKLLRRITSPDDARFYKQRRDGVFVYDGVAVAGVIHDIERYYKTTVDIDDAIKDRIFHGSFKTDDSITTVLNVMAISMNAVMQQKNKGYILTSGHSK